jgi:hypothetical protein
MTIRVRTGLMPIAVLAMMSLASCGHYTCGANFGVSTCTGGPPSLSGGNGSSAAAFVFVANGSATGTMVGYTLNTNAAPPTLTFTPNYTAPSIPNNDAGIGMAVAQKKFLYAAFGSTQQIFGWSISTAGSLTTVGSPLTDLLLPKFNATQFDTRRVITNPAGTLLFVGDEFSSQVFVYQIGSGGVLTPVASSPFSVSFPPGNMTTDGLGNYLYFTDSSSFSHTGSEIAAYSIGSTGGLTAVTGSPFTTSPTGPSYSMWQVQGEPTGKYLIGTTGNSAAPGLSGVDDKHLYVFSINQSGAIAPVTGSPFATTYSPLNIAVQQSAGGNLVYSFGLADSALSFNPVEGFTLNSSGTLSTANGSPFLTAAVGTEGQFDQGGSLLFDYGGIFNINSNTVVYTVTSFDVSAGNLTTATGTGTYGGYWLVTDAP